MVDEETSRYRCEIRYVIALGVTDPARVARYITLVKQRRGEAAGAQLLDDSRQQYRLGNRGESGTWNDNPQWRNP